MAARAAAPFRASCVRAHDTAALGFQSEGAIVLLQREAGPRGDAPGNQKKADGPVGGEVDDRLPFLARYRERHRPRMIEDRPCGKNR